MSEEFEYDPLTAIRVKGQDAEQSKDPQELLALADELRTDAEYWPTWWAVACAIKAEKLGHREEARGYLEEAIAGGFCQPDDYSLSEVFGGDPDWPGLLARMLANVPAPAVELLSWPVPVAALPLGLRCAAPEREERLRELIPAPAPKATAWRTVLSTLDWVAHRWKHANNLAHDRDAVSILEGVEAEERFPCVGYSIVLTEALNAVGVPARFVSLRQRHHHTGISRGHHVSEAWIDDLGTWVLLDGQNALYWHDEGRPLGLPELLERNRSGEAPAQYATFREGFGDDHAAGWWNYFATATTGGYVLADGAFSPVFQDSHRLRGEALLHDPAPAYPNLSGVHIGFANVDGRTALVLRSPHPYASGYVVTQGGADVEVEAAEGVGTYPLPEEDPGEHELTARVRTRYGVVPGGGTVAYRVA